LKLIREYLSEFGDSPTKKFRESFESFCIQVADMPLMFSKYEYNPKYRKAVIIFGYLILYQVDEKRGIVKIYRVLHGKRNAEALIKPPP